MQAVPSGSRTIAFSLSVFTRLLLHTVPVSTVKPGILSTRSSRRRQRDHPVDVSADLTAVFISQQICPSFFCAASQKTQSRKDLIDTNIICLIDLYIFTTSKSNFHKNHPIFFFFYYLGKTKFWNQRNFLRELIFVLGLLEKQLSVFLIDVNLKIGCLTSPFNGWACGSQAGSGSCVESRPILEEGAEAEPSMVTAAFVLGEDRMRDGHCTEKMGFTTFQRTSPK